MKKPTRAPILRHKPKTDRRINISPAYAEASAPLKEFLIPAQDAHGHTARVLVRVPPALKNAIAVILASGKYPFHTESDFARLAIYKCVQWINSLGDDPTLKGLSALLNAYIAGARVQQEHMQFTHTLEAVTRTIHELLAREAIPPARQIVQEVSARVDEIEDPYWRKRYREDIAERFKFLDDIEANGGVIPPEYRAQIEAERARVAEREREEKAARRARRREES